MTSVIVSVPAQTRSGHFRIQVRNVIACARFLNTCISNSWNGAADNLYYAALRKLQFLIRLHLRVVRGWNLARGKPMWFHVRIFSDIYPQSQLRSFIDVIISLCIATCFGPYGPSSGEYSYYLKKLREDHCYHNGSVVHKFVSYYIEGSRGRNML
jgi:hypothetical protein